MAMVASLQWMIRHWNSWQKEVGFRWSEDVLVASQLALTRNQHFATCDPQRALTL
jgi:hypothetical protein